MVEWQNGSIAGKRIPFRRDWRWKLNGNAQVFKGWKRGQTASYGSKGMGPSTWENGCLYLANCVCSKDNYNLLTSLRHSPVFAQKLDANPCSTPQYRSMPGENDIGYGVRSAVLVHGESESKRGFII